jgi:CheY-like chemotaxis protein
MSFHLQTDPGAAAATEAKTVLVVDDYRSLCEMISGILRPRGYRVLTASSGEQAKALARENTKIALLLTDIEMPEMRGDELAAWFRAVKTETRILFMSSQPAASQAHDPSHFLQKPFRAEALISKVREVLNQTSVPSAETATPKSHGN